MARVYISSTYSDLKEYREKVYRALRQLGHDAVAMEDYVASDQRPLDKCLEDVAACDLYVGIFAHRYGYIPENNNPQARSITELEYQHAKTLNIPRLICLLDPAIPWPPPRMDAFTGDGDSGARIRSLREDLGRDRLVSFFNSADELAQKVSIAVSNEHSRSAAQSRTGPVIAGNIPVEPEAFQKRAAIAMLAAAWKANERIAIIHAIAGGRGVGKTQVAAAYARQRAKEGWPLVAWISAETENRLVGHLSDLAESIGISDPLQNSGVGFLSIPAMRKSASNVRPYLEAFEGPGLIIFDNATDPDGLAPFIPSVGNVQVVVTSNDRAFASMGRLVDVDVFGTAESLAYLRERTHLPDDREASALANDLSYLPLALAQAATVINAQGLDYRTYRDRLRRFPLESYLTRRRGDHYPKGAAEAILLSVQDAEKRDPSGLTTRILRILSIFPDGLSVSSIHNGLTDTQLAETDISSVEEIDIVIGNLIDASILQRTRGSVSMHRLIGRVISDRDVASGNPIRWEWGGKPSNGAGYVIVEGLVALRDSFDLGNRRPIMFSLTEWNAFMAGVRNGEFDLPALS
jgi:Domain of unknown function (DUF4062)